MASSSRGQHLDSFIDEEEDTCPLCVEELDLGDKNFKPCPCGYQVCQFCFHNIKNNMNGLCPACRRPYDEATIEFKIVTPEEIAQFKANAQKNAKKKAAERQKEAQKREVETLNRKHLAGLRVIQRNLVYVMGLSPGIPEQDLLQTLRGDKYFGQYGKIIKIAVGKAKNGDTSQSISSLGVYVTFARKEDAARCIAAVNGSTNGDRVLRAQLGTTKYCSAYLRGETCTNKSCMFLHEPGDNDDSYSRQDLSTINSVGTQRPLPVTTPSMTAATRQITQAQAPMQQPQAAAPLMARDHSKDGYESGDGSALPSSASWAHRGLQNASRRGSVATSGATSSPAVGHAVPAATGLEEERLDEIYHETENTQEPEEEPLPAPIEPAKPRIDPLLFQLVKSVNSVSEMFDNWVVDESVSGFPSLIDPFGGIRRRLAREHAEARLLEDEAQRTDHDALSEAQTIPEPLEDEAPESGSLQLGGEPEDRDFGRDSSQAQILHEQRNPRAAQQGPISRASNDSSAFGNVTSFQNPGSRSMTPQQQQQHMLGLFKSAQSQNSFIDQYPPGMGPPQSSLFQQQGHNRQSSRYTFATDNASVKSTSSSKQAMGPPQPAQFYGSSIQGPPPGLKSTGTPPINGGAMFGQGAPGFGGLLGGSTFGVNRENDIYRDMMRSRGELAGDAGKREYMFPTFLNQYPSASTRAPTSNLLATLYGVEPGAFALHHDMSFKQKKKGKKHRHANTSSSGGSGLVNLADPNLLGRMPHQQQQSNAGIGQGLFSGQAQEDEELPTQDEAGLDIAMAIDNLVADDSTEISSVHHFIGSNNPSRTGTPSIPPGFEGHGHSSPPKFATRIPAPTAPFTPSRAASFAHTPHIATPLANVSTPATPVQNVSTPVIPPATTKTKNEVKSSTAAGLSKENTSLREGVVISPIVQTEEFPALSKSKGKAKEQSTKTTKASTPAAKRAVVKEVKSNDTLATPTKSSSRPAPSILDTAGVTKAVPTIPSPASTVPTSKTIEKEVLTKTPAESSSFPPLPVSNSSVLNISTPVRAAPRSLRLLAKTAPSPGPSAAMTETPLSATTENGSVFPQVSRQVSLASVLRLDRLDRPGTPASELMSDVMSVPSTMSRPNSPPLTRVGAAPVREKTKSQQKKQRKEAQREKEKTDLEAVVDEPEPEIAPIAGRKKKQKKEKSARSVTQPSTPVASVPVSPESQLVPESSSLPLKTEAIRELETPHVKIPEQEKAKAPESKSKTKSKPVTPPLPPPPPPASPPPPPAPTVESEKETEKSYSPMSIIHDLAAMGQIDLNQISLLKQPSFNLTSRTETSGDIGDFEPRLIITDEDRANLLAGRIVHKTSQGSQRIMLTPNGDCVRNLSTEEEQRFQDLQNDIALSNPQATFVSSRHNQLPGFTIMQGRALANGPPSFFPLGDHPAGGNGTLDAVSKIQRDEALSYINQYVLPSLSTNSQLERALNANATDAGMHPPGSIHSSQSWPSFSNDTGLHTYGGSSDSGILATGLESMTAHFAGGNMPGGRSDGRGQPLGNVTLLSLPDSETAYASAKKESEKLEKQFGQLLKKNRKILLGAGH